MGSAVQFCLAPLFLFDLLIFGLMMERKQIYTPEFKRWFGDWPLAARAAAIRAMAAEPITTDLKYTRSEAKDLYCKIEKAVNKADGKTVMFYHGIFGKMYKPDGLFVRVIPQLKTLFENSLFAYSETDDRAGTARPDGTIHKELRNVVNYDNYVAKAFLNGKVYYVRFTIMNETDGKRGIHSSMVTDVSLYDETANVASVPVTHGGRLDTDGIVDTKLQDFFERAKKSSKVVDFDGYPLVVYHGTTKDFTTFSKKTIGKANNGRYGFFFTPDESLATDFTRRRWQNTESQPKKNAHNIAVYLNLRNPLIVTAYQYVMNAVDNMDLSGYDGIIITPFSKEEKARWDSIWGKNSGSKEFDHNQYVVFSPNQIKSATANNGQFNPESDNILEGLQGTDEDVIDGFYREYCKAIPENQDERNKYNAGLLFRISRYLETKEINAYYDYQSVAHYLYRNNIGKTILERYFACKFPKSITKMAEFILNTTFTPATANAKLRLAKAKAKALKMKLELMKI